MKATLYYWEGTPETGHKAVIGVVRMDAHSPRAVWDEDLNPYFNPMPNDPRTYPRVPLDPTDGVNFIQGMPFVFRSAPYTWAEVEMD